MHHILRRTFTRIPGFPIGACNHIRVKNLSSTCWMNRVSGGDVSFTNCAEHGLTKSTFSDLTALVEVECSSGKRHQFLLDDGWKKRGMSEILREQNLRPGDLEFVCLSEHMMHIGGLADVLSFDPTVTVVHPEPIALMEGTQCAFAESNTIPGHKGNTLPVDCGSVAFFPWLEDCCAHGFRLGEESGVAIIANVKGKGLVVLAGNRRPETIDGIVEFARKNLGWEGQPVYGKYMGRRGGGNVAAGSRRSHPAEKDGKIVEIAYGEEITF